MNITMKIIFSISLFAAAIAANAQLAEVPMDANTLVEIEAYLQKENVFEITEVENPGQGRWYATAENLVKAVPALKLDRVKKDPNSIVKNQYKTDNVMMILPELPEPKKSKKK
ncbi:MAG TPA: hypothetical protein PKC28_03090 [Bdellovibrionales bacterium]|nr:hypothetical protein [Bdellovibrionales bacterium]